VQYSQCSVFPAAMKCKFYEVWFCYTASRDDVKWMWNLNCKHKVNREQDFSAINKWQHEVCIHHLSAFICNWCKAIPSIPSVRPKGKYYYNNVKHFQSSSAQKLERTNYNYIHKILNIELRNIINTYSLLELRSLKKCKNILNLNNK